MDQVEDDDDIVANSPLCFCSLFFQIYRLCPLVGARNQQQHAALDLAVVSGFEPPLSSFFFFFNFPIPTMLGRGRREEKRGGWEVAVAANEVANDIRGCR